jgi:hypothetical protein
LNEIKEKIDSEKEMNLIELTGVCETDGIYVIENVKGRKIPDGCHGYMLCCYNLP